MIKRIIKGIVLAVFFAGALLISNYKERYQGGRSVPCAIVFCTSHSLNRIFIIDMGSAYGTEHIVRIARERSEVVKHRKR